MNYGDIFRETILSSTLEEKIDTIRSNNEKAAEIKNKMRKSKGMKHFSQNDQEELNSFVSQSSIVLSENEKENDLYNAISLLDIDNLSEDKIISKISLILGNFGVSKRIISKVKLRLYKEYLLINSMMFETSNIEELHDLENVIKNLMLKINLIDEIEEEYEEEEIIQGFNHENNLFFLLSKSGNIVALENLRKNVPQEYYQMFKEMLLDLKNGNSKRIKKLSTLNYYEIKGFKVRITFDVLSEGNFLIIDAFMKKYDTSLYYRQRLNVRNSLYLSTREYYLSKIEDDKFLLEHRSYFDDIMNLLDKSKEEAVTYERRLV